MNENDKKWNKEKKIKNNNNILIIQISQIIIKLQHKIFNVNTLYKICYEKNKINVKH